MSFSNSYAAWQTVDEMVSKPVLGSDSAASWQDFKKNQKKRPSDGTYGRSLGNAPQMPTKRADKLGTGFRNLEEERAHEEKIRKERGEASVGSGYTHFKPRPEDEEIKPLSETEPRIRPDNKIYFIASEEFTGWKEDYVFTTRHRGTGYYWDGMDSLRRQMRGMDNDINKTDGQNSEPKKKKKKKKSNNKKENNTSLVLEDSAHDSKNPFQQIENAIKRRNEVLMARARGTQINSQPVSETLQQTSTALNPTKTTTKSELTAAGWAEVLDPSTNKTYYYHTQTRETKWEYPLQKSKTEMEQKISNNAASNDMSRDKDVKSSSIELPTGWKSAADSNGKEYYYNTITKETTWNRPFVKT